jgi:hypothetical protein
MKLVVYERFLRIQSKMIMWVSFGTEVISDFVPSFKRFTLKVTDSFSPGKLFGDRKSHTLFNCAIKQVGMKTFP